MKFLVKEIRSKTGELHFRRWRFLETPWLRIYLHNIVKADEDKHEHDHPWNFISIILKGTYIEQSHYGWDSVMRPFRFVYHKATDTHKLKEVFGPVWTLVVAWGRRRKWGYMIEDGWVDNETYRTNKHAGMYNDKSH